MFKVKLNKTLSLLWLAAVGALLVSVNFKGNALWNNVIFITFLALMVLAIWKHYAPQTQTPPSVDSHSAGDSGTCRTGEYGYFNSRSLC